MNINIKINSESKNTESISDYAPMLVKHRDNSMYICYNCENDVIDGIVFNKLVNMSRLSEGEIIEDEYCWDCLVKKFKHAHKVEVIVND